MKVLNECHATHVLWVILDVELDGGIYVMIWFEEKSRSGQIRSNKKTFFTEASLSCEGFDSRLQKCHLFSRTMM